VTESPRPFLLERYFALHEFSARYLLSASDCQGLAMVELVANADADLRRRWETLRLGYTESQGLPELRQEIAELYRGVTSGEILVAAPEEAVFLFMNALLAPGDHVICTFPGYQSLFELAHSIGCEVTFWEAAEEDRWRFPVEQLEGYLRPHTKLVICNFPHNPTGALPTKEDFAKILAAAESKGAWVLSDEMYRLLEPADGTRLPASVDLYERAVSLSGMSKVFGLAGLRIGWVATHSRSLLERMSLLKDYTTICSSAPSELLALMALRSREKILRTHRDLVRRNTQSAHEFFLRRSEHFSWVPPEGGTVCFPRILRRESGREEEEFAAEDLGTAKPQPPEAAGAEAFCARILRHTGVLLLPSTVYDYGDDHFRLGLGREDFAEGLEVLDTYLRDELGRLLAD